MSKSNNNNTKSASGRNSTRKRTNNTRPSIREKDRVEHTPGRPHIVDAVAASLNDPEWYAENPALLMDAASISYNAAVGHPIHWMEGATPSDHTWKSNYVSIPGIMSFKTVPIPGWTENSQSPINIASRNIYAYVRHVNSGHANYDPADLMLYLLALDSAYSLVAWMRRVAGELNVVSQYNRYLPIAQIQSEGLDYADFSKHIVDLRYFINQYQLKLGSFVIPAELKFFTRHMWMFSNVYLDEPNQKAQMYKFVPSGFWKYVETEGPGKLVWSSLTGVTTFDDLVKYAEDLLIALAASEDCGIISGDILKAFGADKIFRMDALTPEYVVIPVPNEEVMDQIQNLSICGTLVSPPDQNELAITQSTGVGTSDILFRPCALNTSGTAVPRGYAVDRMISVDNPVPTPATTMVATRLLAMGEFAEGGVILELKTVGSEFIENAIVYALDEQMQPSGTYLPLMIEVVANTAAELTSHFNYLALVEMFDRHPAFYYFTSANRTDKLMLASFDVSNYTFVSERVMYRMHETALLSLFDVPVMGTFSNKLG